MTDVKEYWTKKLAGYDEEDWARKPSIFAQLAVEYFPKSGSLLELGCGLGQDSNWFASKVYKVTATDLLPLAESEGFNFKIVDLSQPLPFEGQSFEVVYAHLSLHYFSLDRTKQLFKEIKDILKPGGIFAFLVNSIHDPEASEGEAIEKNFKGVKGIQKRYFDLALTTDLTKDFEVLLLDENGTSYKDKAEGRQDLIRFIGKKK